MTSSPSAPPNRHTTLVLASGKGGVLKTTTAVALSAVYRDAGSRVALVDLDPQAGATLGVGVRPPADALGCGPVAAHGFTVWPASRALAMADVGQIAERLADARAAAEIVVVDLSPALSDAGHAAALTLADPLVIIARLDAAGLPQVAETVRIAELLGCAWRVVPTFDARTRLAREAQAYLRSRYGAAVTDAVLPTDVRAAEAASRCVPVVDASPRARASVAIRALAHELLAPVAQGAR